jgi:NAD+ diphosphatase
VLTRKNSGLANPLFAMSDAHALGPVNEAVFLGKVDGAPRFGLGLAPATAEALKARNDLMITDLRSIATQGLVAPEHLPPLAEAKALLHWHARHRYCSNCGVLSSLVDGGWKRLCPTCGAEHFPRTDPVVIMLAVAGDNCLLGRSARFVKSMWSCLAGFVEPGEAIEDAVRRETLEEAGIRCGRVAYFRSQPWPFPMSLMIGCHAEALNHDVVVDRSELEDARWFSREEVALMLMRRHPEGFGTPPPVAIAHHIIRAWVEGESALT